MMPSRPAGLYLDRRHGRGTYIREGTGKKGGAGGKPIQRRAPGHHTGEHLMHDKRHTDAPVQGVGRVIGNDCGGVREKEETVKMVEDKVRKVHVRRLTARVQVDPAWVNP